MLLKHTSIFFASLLVSVTAFSQQTSLSTVKAQLDLMFAGLDKTVLNHLTGSRGNFSLDLSRNDALTLGVSPEVYDFYSNFVEQLNQKQ